MKLKYSVGIISSFLVLSAYFSCSETETDGFPDRSQTCFHGQENQEHVVFLAGSGTPGERDKVS